MDRQKGAPGEGEHPSSSENQGGSEARLKCVTLITQGEPQKSCSKPVAEEVTESCQEICQCRPPPPLPPPPPPPPPPRLQVVPTPKSTFCPTEETWWPGLVIIIAVCCATLVFLFVVVIICYKAIKRKPMRKEENGTSRAEYAMTSSQNNKTVDNNAVV
ncbi:PREDICTED: proline-rich membrane anchor 1 [Calidris pugnax]|uniref:proline-rich membrane anchor 1 n=1 Tax=Calidris pugnax TaxID=198806 RepID=UPI00071D4CD8|nr:PREDICTED: proline-rich membrane anchor 1 [Calidris pugnax]